jgi:hypothetical protein
VLISSVVIACVRAALELWDFLGLSAHFKTLGTEIQQLIAYVAPVRRSLSLCLFPFLPLWSSSC